MAKMISMDLRARLVFAMQGGWTSCVGGTLWCQSELCDQAAGAGARDGLGGSRTARPLPGERQARPVQGVADRLGGGETRHHDAGTGRAAAT